MTAEFMAILIVETGNMKKGMGVYKSLSEYVADRFGQESLHTLPQDDRVRLISQPVLDELKEQLLQNESIFRKTLKGLSKKEVNIIVQALSSK